MIRASPGGAGTGLGLLSVQKAIQRKFGKQTLCTKMIYHGGHGGTPLMLAMLTSQYEGAAALVALGARVEPQSARGWRAADFAEGADANANIRKLDDP